MRTELNLTQLNSETNRILLADTSVYNPDLPVENSYLEVTPPGFSGYIQVLYVPGSVVVLTAQNLKLSESLEDLSSGIYHVLMTIKPNDRIRKDFWFLHAEKERRCLADVFYKAKEYMRPVKEIVDTYVELETLILKVRMAESDEIPRLIKLFDILSKKIKHLTY